MGQFFSIMKGGSGAPGAYPTVTLTLMTFLHPPWIGHHERIMVFRRLLRQP